MIDDVLGIHKNIEPFDAQSHYKKDFAKWLDENFRYFNTSKDAPAFIQIRENIDKIYDGVMYLKNLTETRSAPILQMYYSSDWPRITSAYREPDVKKFAEAVDSLKFGIEWE